MVSGRANRDACRAFAFSQQGRALMKIESVATEITVQSSTVDLGDAFREHARAGILRVASKYFGRLTTGSAHVTRDGASYRCTVNMQPGALKMMSGEASDKEIYAAFDRALDKVAKQLRRTKREVRDDKGERVGKDATLRGA
jgi:ribosomal subunit interface protein